MFFGLSATLALPLMRCRVILILLTLVMTQASWADSIAPRREVKLAPHVAVARLVARREYRVGASWFAAHAPEISRWQVELSSIPAPLAGESARAEWFLARFRECGLQDVHRDEVGNVIGIRPGRTPRNADGEPRYVALTAHLDTVFPAATPLAFRTEGTRIYGPGISDNGSGLAALLAIAEALQAADAANSRPILFVANVGEEGEGDLRGMRHLFEDVRWRDAIDCTIVLDGGGTDTIITEGLGSRRFQVTVRGPGGHSWSDFGTPNPVVLLARAIDEFSRTSLPVDPKVAFNIGVISGGTSVNTIPESATMKVDLRSASAAEIDRLEKALREALEHATTQFKNGVAESKRTAAITYELKPIGDRPAGELAADARLLQIIKAVDSYLGINSRQQRASTDANIPLAAGREAIAIGAGGTGGGAHTLHEWYDPAGRDLGLRRILLTVLTLAETE